MLLRLYSSIFTISASQSSHLPTRISFILPLFHPDRSRRITTRGGRWQSPGHSAHIGQEVEVHYRWHAHYGRRVRRQYVERRAGGDVVHVEVAPGNVVVVAAWMLDAAACAGMELGTPRVRLSCISC